MECVCVYLCDARVIYSHRTRYARVVGMDLGVNFVYFGSVASYELKKLSQYNRFR